MILNVFGKLNTESLNQIWTSLLLDPPFPHVRMCLLLLDPTSSYCCERLLWMTPNNLVFPPPNNSILYFLLDVDVHHWPYLTPAPQSPCPYPMFACVLFLLTPSPTCSCRRLLWMTPLQFN